MKAYIKALAFGLFLLLPSVSGAAIVIDPGHGGYDGGLVHITSTGKEVKEKDVDLKISLALMAALRARGYNVRLTREVDRSMTIPERLASVGGSPVSAFLSIHLSDNGSFNIYAWNKPVQNGDFKSMYLRSNIQARHTADSQALAQAIQQALKGIFPARTVAIFEMPLPVLGGVDGPAVMVESPSAAELDYQDPASTAMITNALANAVSAIAIKPVPSGAGPAKNSPAPVSNRTSPDDILNELK